MARLELQRLRRSYPGGVTAVDGIDLVVEDGEFMVLVGPSGCGKSTTLRMIAGLEPVTSGHLRIGDRDVTDVPPAQRGVAMVFQSYALYPHMTVAENMGFALKMAGHDGRIIREKVGRAAEALQLTHLLDRTPRALSGGQRQRVAIGRAIVREPKVFLFDEPLSNLDAALRTQMRLELARLHESLGATIVYVTHDQVEAMTLGDRIAVFNAGRIEQVGTPMALYREPANRFVAGFLGAPQMNFLPVRVIGAGGGIAGAAPAAGVDCVGVRPEHWLIVADSEGHGLPARVERIESLGDVALVHCRVDGVEQPVAVKAAELSAAAIAGAAVRLRTRPEHLRFFDGDGRALAAA
jgi:multiple sugar transport system ATP-binding protein